MNCFRRGKFSIVGGQGSVGGGGGGSSLLGHEHWPSPRVGTPELEHCVGLMVLTMAGVVLSHNPTCGKFGDTRPRSIHVLRDR